MPYVRPFYAKPETPHPLYTTWSAGNDGILSSMLSDSGWEAEYLKELHEDSEKVVLNQHLGTIAKIKQMDEELKDEWLPDVLEAKKIELRDQCYVASLSFFKKYIDRAMKSVQEVEREIMNYTEPQIPPDKIDKLGYEMKIMQGQNILMGTERKLRPAMLRNNPLLMQAALLSPIELIAPSVLSDLRRQYAYDQDATLLNKLSDMKHLYSKTRSRAGQINGLSMKLWMDQGYNPPFDAKSHFDVFPPRTPHETTYANQRIQEQERRREKARLTAKWLKDHPGQTLDSFQEPPDRKRKAGTKLDASDLVEVKDLIERLAGIPRNMAKADSSKNRPKSQPLPRATRRRR